MILQEGWGCTGHRQKPLILPWPEVPGLPSRGGASSQTCLRPHFSPLWKCEVSTDTFLFLRFCPLLRVPSALSPRRGQLPVVLCP